MNTDQKPRVPKPRSIPTKFEILTSEQRREVIAWFQNELLGYLAVQKRLAERYGLHISMGSIKVFYDRVVAPRIAAAQNTASKRRGAKLASLEFTLRFQDRIIARSKIRLSIHATNALLSNPGALQISAGSPIAPTSAIVDAQPSSAS